MTVSPRLLDRRRLHLGTFEFLRRLLSVSNVWLRMLVLALRGLRHRHGRLAEAERSRDAHVVSARGIELLRRVEWRAGSRRRHREGRNVAGSVGRGH